IRPARVAEAVALFAALVIVAWAVLGDDRNLLFLPLPLIGWAAWRFQLRGAAPAALIVAGTASWTAAHGMGPFGSGSLVLRMLTLQAFNTGIALCSFVFAAAITERMQIRRALEAAATGLERRVAERTADLSNANARLEAEIAERERVQEELRSSERLLAETQRIAHTGSWAWWIADDRVEWSEEMYRIYGYEDRDPLTIARAIEGIHPEDLERISENLRGYLDERATRDLPTMEYRIVRPDGTVRSLRAKSRLIVGDDHLPLRLIGWVQDITEDKVAERERAIAETLQRSLLLERLPEIPGVALAARYVPASADMLVGGDWYDAVELPDGRLGLAIGDVAGHGLASTSAMGQLRTALRAFASEDPAPERVLARVHRITRDWLDLDMATLLFAVFDPRTNELRFSNAGHPPPLVVTPGEGSGFVRGALAPPLGAAPAHEGFEEATITLAPGSTLLLYTDGLIERRGLSVSVGLTRLQAWTSADAADLDRFLERVIENLVEQPASDDVAVLALRPAALGPGPFRMDVAPEPRRLEILRHGIRRWLEAVAVPRGTADDVLVACMEACTNVIRHAGAPDARFEIRLARRNGRIEATVRDRGTWRPEDPVGEGRGLELMRALMDEVEILPRPDGTTVRMRRRLAAEPVPSDGRSDRQEVRPGQDIPAQGS
ncbi:MAG TPA: SpoIIE family protein phosphatase, partial [Actinomycetota bacterium]|nr:SpoIIE family protein phosphatase [Actinomycetota bacterium]